jgi:branched-chain amino acid transport system substrate-binding protein
MQQHGDTVAGRQIQITIRDDGGVADNARRLVQEMIVDQKVDILGIGITPTSLAIAPLVTESRKATLVMSSGASITTAKSPYFVRAGFILAPQSWVLAEWAAKNGSKRVVTLVNDWAPGVEAETAFTTRFKQVGGEIAESDVVSLGAYDGLHLIYEALKKTGGNPEGEALIAAMKGMAWESPRGPVSIDPDTRDIVSNIYIRKVVKTDGQLWSEEFETYPNVKDPMKLAAAK